MKPRIYHNPRCSKSRATLALLEAHGLEPEVIEYLDNPPDVGRLTILRAKLGIAARDLVRSGEDEFRDAGLDLETASDEAIFAALVERPRLLQRPIVEFGDAARIGRPPERILELFE